MAQKCNVLDALYCLAHIKGDIANILKYVSRLARQVRCSHVEKVWSSFPAGESCLLKSPLKPCEHGQGYGSLEVPPRISYAEEQEQALTVPINLV